MLFAAATEWPQAGRAEIEIGARKDRPARTATLELKFGTKRPGNCLAKDLPGTITLQLVEVAEINAPPDIEPVHWRLLTTRAVKSAVDAWAVVEDYRRGSKARMRSTISWQSVRWQGSPSCSWSKVATPDLFGARAR
jgi:hypothetical protein